MGVGPQSLPKAGIEWLKSSVDRSLFGDIENYSQRSSGAVLQRLYQRLQQRLPVDDPEISRLGIPFVKINSKSVADFIRRQEAIACRNVAGPAAPVVQGHKSVTQATICHLRATIK